MFKLTKKSFNIEKCSDWSLNQLKEFAAEIDSPRKTGTKAKICESIEKRLRELKDTQNRPADLSLWDSQNKKPSVNVGNKKPSIQNNKKYTNLSSKGITELKNIAKELGISGYSKYKTDTKGALEELIRKHRDKSPIEESEGDDDVSEDEKETPPSKPSVNVDNKPPSNNGNKPQGLNLLGGDVNKLVQQYLGPTCEELTNEYSNCYRVSTFKNPNGQIRDCNLACKENMNEWIYTLRNTSTTDDDNEGYNLYDAYNSRNCAEDFIDKLERTKCTVLLTYDENLLTIENVNIESVHLEMSNDTRSFDKHRMYKKKHLVNLHNDKTQSYVKIRFQFKKDTFDEKIKQFLKDIPNSKFENLKIKDIPEIPLNFSEDFGGVSTELINGKEIVLRYMYISNIRMNVNSMDTKDFNISLIDKNTVLVKTKNQYYNISFKFDVSQVNKKEYDRYYDNIEDLNNAKLKLGNDQYILYEYKINMFTFKVKNQTYIITDDTAPEILREKMSEFLIDDEDNEDNDEDDDNDDNNNKKPERKEVNKKYNNVKGAFLNRLSDGL